MTIPAGPTFSNANLATATAILDVTLSGTYATKTFSIFETCKIYLLGAKDATTTPAKEVSEWITKNEAAIRTAGEASYTTVSSWAIVVDLTWKSAFTTPVRHRGTEDTLVPNPAAVDG
jgi:hypothetical protein